MNFLCNRGCYLNRSLNSGNCSMYADDTNVFLKNKCYEELYKIANQELINIDNWLSANRLILNTDKTHYMIFRTAKTKPPSNNLTLAIRNNFVSQQIKNKVFGNNFLRTFKLDTTHGVYMKKTVYHLWYY